MIRGRIRFDGRKITLSQVFAGQTVGIKQVEDHLWLASFMHYDLGYTDLEQRALQTIDNRSARGCHPCLRNIPLPMSPGRTQLKLVPRGGFEPPTRGFSVRCSTN